MDLGGTERRCLVWIGQEENKAQVEGTPETYTSLA